MRRTKIDRCYFKFLIGMHQRGGGRGITHAHLKIVDVRFDSFVEHLLRELVLGWRPHLSHLGDAELN